MFQVFWSLRWQNQLLELCMAKHRTRYSSWCPVVENKKALGSQQIYSKPETSFSDFSAHTWSIRKPTETPQALQSADRRLTPIVEENGAPGRQQIFTNPQDNLKATQPYCRQKESAGNPWELDRPKYKYPRGSMTISSENALVRAMRQE